MRIGVVTFPGSNCDYDAYAAFRHVLDCPVEFLWHADPDLHDVDCVILPGGFSFGDYLRAGAIARFSPVMQSVIKFAADGGLVWGICNGFQVLTEAGLLPGTLRRNAHMRFTCQNVRLRVENNKTPFTRGARVGQILKMPIAHGEGNYYADHDVLERLEANNQVVFRYVNAQGEPDLRSNPNGSRHNIAGIVNAQGNVLGMMPHPERAVESILGSADGLVLFQSLLGVGVPAVGTETPSASPLIEKRRARV